MTTDMIGRITQGDAIEVLRTMDDESVQCCVTSPPYWGLRDYGCDGQLGLEATPDEYVAKLVEVFREVRRVLRDDGVLWLNLGDSYAGARAGPQGATGQLADRAASRNGARERSTTTIVAGLRSKDLVGIPWRVAFALQADGWWLRSDVIWHKPNPMPESVTDRPTKAHEYVFLLTKSARYYYDADAIREQAQNPSDKTRPPTSAHVDNGTVLGRANNPHSGLTTNKVHRSGKRNKRTVWTIPTQPYPGAHYAVMPAALVEPCILAGCPEGGIVLDPFAGSGTVGVVAARLGRQFIGIDINGGDVDLGPHTANERLDAIQRGQSVEEMRAGQLMLWDPSPA